MKAKPGFTIFIPVKNGGNYILPCVESILAQTYGNYELVILGGYSTDGTCEWLRTIEAQDSRIKLLFSDTELGIERNWQRITGVAKREFMTIVGYDDLLGPDFLQEICALIQSTPEASLYQTHFDLVDSKGDLIRHCRPIPGHEMASEFLAARMSIIRDSFGTGYVMRSKDYDRLGGIPMFKNLLYADDALWIGLMQPTFKVSSPRICFSYRFHAGSVSGAPDPEALFHALGEYLEYLSKLANKDDDVARVLGYYAPQYVRNACQDHMKYLYRQTRARHKIDPNKIEEIERLLRGYIPYAELDWEAVKTEVDSVGAKFLRRLVKKSINLFSRLSWLR